MERKMKRNESGEGEQSGVSYELWFYLFLLNLSLPVGAWLFR